MTSSASDYTKFAASYAFDFLAIDLGVPASHWNSGAPMCQFTAGENQRS